MKNPYKPLLAEIAKITVENEAKDLKTFDLVLRNGSERDGFSYSCGQFAEVSVPGIGECPFGIASSPMDEGVLQFTVKRYPDGLVTNALHNLGVGGIVGVRGPLGNSYPMERLEGANVLVVSGGFAFTTLRSTVRYMLHEKNRGRFGKIAVIYGAREPGELLYKSELEEWKAREDVETHITIDRDALGWKGLVGFVPNVVAEVAPKSENTIAIVCGPPIMLHFTFPRLLELGFPPDRIITSLENKMKCGVGLCGRCNVGPKYVCCDGPVFTYEEIKALPQEL